VIRPSVQLTHDPWLAVPAHVTEVIRESPGVMTYEITLDDPQTHQRFRFEPGQFNMLYMPGIGEAAISISGPTDCDGRIPHTIRTAGNVTRSLAEAGEGAALGLRGPFGSRWPIADCTGRDLVLVAGGIGLAPLRPVIYEIVRHRDHYGSVTLLYGARSPSGLLYTQEHAAWRSEGITICTTVDRAESDWEGNVGVVTLLLDRLRLNDPNNTTLMMCGPEVMMWYTVQSALRKSIKESDLWLSLERNMNCGIGLCGHCQFGAQFVCRDGPVFRFDQVASILRTDDL